MTPPPASRAAPVPTPRYVTWAVPSLPWRGTFLPQTCGKTRSVARGRLRTSKTAYGAPTAVPQRQDGGGLLRPPLPLPRPLLVVSSAPPPPGGSRDRRALPRGGLVGGGAARGRRAGRSSARRSFLLDAWPEDTMSGVSRRLLWAATCLAALCVAAAQMGNSPPPPNVTEPSPVTNTPVPATLTPTVLPGGCPPHATTRWDPRNMAARPVCRGPTGGVRRRRAS